MLTTTIDPHNKWTKKRGQVSDVRLSRHLSNACVKETVNGTHIVKESHSSPKRIDLAVAAVVAFDRAVHAKPASKPRLIWLHEVA
jgi:phage terminase large subunit-like protein